MLRREFLALGAAAGFGLAQAPKPEGTTASATQDTTPRVSIVLSSFKKGSDHDGTDIEGLKDPRPPAADLTSAQLDAMVRRAIEVAATRAGDLSTIVGAEDWVVIKTHIPSCYGLGSYIPGSVTDPRIVRTLISWLVEHKCGMRFTVVEGSPEWQPVARSKAPADGWTTDWGGAFDGLSYQKMIEELAKRHAGIRFEIADLNFADSMELPVSGKALARNNSTGVYSIPKVIRSCDRLISVAPLKTDAATGVSLSLANYLGIAPGAKYGFPKRALLELGAPEEIMVDLFGFRPADFAMVGGCQGVEGAGAEAASVHHNVMIAGDKAVCVDAVTAAVMGFEIADLPFLALGEKKGHGTCELQSIWTRGNEIEEARRPFRKPSGWKPRRS